ncbi:MAG TPA: hypothetical protein VK815_01645 [Candidatus Acidoferrales bacterium]|jgi:hypothetical protein|nr:hypothetical protein [Candidatus Acidoferrales bacterium]
MNTDTLDKGPLVKKSAGLCLVTREMVHARVAELAFIDGRLAREATMSDFAQAKRELTDEAEKLLD